MRVVLMFAAGLALVSGLVAGASCLVDRKTSDFSCSSPSDCDMGRTCTGGFCVVVDAAPCEANCTSLGGTCNGDVCMFSGNASVTCPPNIKCDINCDAPGSCTGTINCGQASSCTVSCDGNSSCPNSIACSGADSCTVTCAGAGACASGVACGGGKCDVECTGTNSCAGATTCGSSCSCKVDCGGTGSCAAAAVCPEPSGAAGQCLSGNGCTIAPNKCHSC